MKIMCNTVIRTGAALCGAAVLVITASAATIDTTLNPVGPVFVGDQFEVSLSVSGWDAATDGGVSALTFYVDFDLALFSYVAGSWSAVSDGTEFLGDGLGGGYSLTDNSSDALVAFGRLGIALEDGDATPAGSVGGGDGAGPVGSFRLLALAVGTGDITPDGNLVAVFADTAFFDVSPAAGVTFNKESMTVVVPEPQTTGFVMALAAAGAVCLRRRNRGQK